MLAKLVNQVRKEISSRLGRLRLWQQLALLVLASALPLLLATLLMFNALVANEREGIRHSLLARAKTLAALVDTEIASHSAVATTLSYSTALQTGDLATFWKEARLALEFLPGSWLAVSTPDGKLLVDTIAEPGAPLPDHVAPDVIRQAFSNNRPQIGGVIFRQVSRSMMTFVEVPVFRNGAPLYSLSISIEPARFLALLKYQAASGEVSAILDQNARFVARIPDHDVRVGTLASDGWRAAIAASPDGLAQNKTVEGDWSLTGYARTAHGWTVGVAQLESQIARPLQAIFKATAVAAGLLTLLSLGLAALIGRHVHGGMAGLAGAASRLGEGRYADPPSGPFAEAAIIARALSTASRELKARDDLLVRANAELEDKVARRTAELQSQIRRREETESTLRQVQKMESIGQLTGGIAHDFNNLLTVIIGNLDTLQRRMLSAANVATLKRPVESALQAANSAARLTHRLLAFSRQQALSPAVVDLNSLVNSLSDMLSRTVGEQVQVETVLAGGLWATFADPNQMESSLLNLVVNARDAMPSGGKLTIETANSFLDEAYVARFGDLKPGQYVMLGVSDSGTGVPPEIIDRLFEPFFTTKEPGKGTGLGLAMVHGFVKQSGGHIRIYSERDQGTTVKIYLPRHHAKASRIATKEDPSEVVAIPRAQPGECVLVAEDDVAVRDYAIEVLEDLGYQVIAVGDGHAALQALEANEHVDLLFTDVVLGGGIGGRQLADAAKDMRPSLQVLFTTGYTRNAIVHNGRLDAGVNLLNKPYTQRDLGTRIRAILDAAARG